MSARRWHADSPGWFRSPEGVTAVRDRTGRIWTRHTTRWTTNGNHWIRWRTLVADHGPLSEETR
ncbi:hypothetical protein ACFUJR_00920 [Streptomyces sp. NPDC057271]|uniref:hypothetical protein n=1 Tax=unclassified Streptomyces TaxID=2593676 RepID=UPI00362E381C